MRAGRSTLRLLAIPYSTNVERVTLALGHKGLDAEIEMIDPGDRARVREVSGQDLVPVLIDDGTVIADSPAILIHLDKRRPEPSLYPGTPRARAQAEVFVQWFNGVWKGLPNEIDACDRSGLSGGAWRAELAGRMDASLDLIEDLLAGRRYLLGETFGIADCVAFPFLKYAVLPPAPDDSDSFHRVLAECLDATEARPRLRAWVAHVDSLPRGGHVP